MPSEILLNTGSGNGLVPDGTKALPEQILTSSPMEVNGFHLTTVLLEVLQASIHRMSLKMRLKITLTSPRRQLVNGWRDWHQLLYSWLIRDWCVDFTCIFAWPYWLLSNIYYGCAWNFFIYELFELYQLTFKLVIWCLKTSIFRVNHVNKALCMSIRNSHVKTVCPLVRNWWIVHRIDDNLILTDNIFREFKLFLCFW